MFVAHTGCSISIFLKAYSPAGQGSGAAALDRESPETRPIEGYDSVTGDGQAHAGYGSPRLEEGRSRADARQRRRFQPPVRSAGPPKCPSGPETPGPAWRCLLVRGRTLRHAFARGRVADRRPPRRRARPRLRYIYRQIGRTRRENLHAARCRVVSPFLVFVFRKPPLQVGRYSGINAIVATLDKVNKIH